MFFVLEGSEGTGKSTLLLGLSERFRQEGYDPLVTREPGGTPLGDAVRRIFLDRSSAIDPLAEALLVNAARAQHVSQLIRPALESGKVVLCDRFVDSTLAYQGYGRGVDLTTLRAICDAATAGLEPSLVLVLDAPLDVSRARTLARGEDADRIEAEHDRFHERVRAGFLELARAPGHRVIDATLAPPFVLDAAWAAVEERLNRPV
jgi:dTMP kinase